jgi:transposase
MPNGRSWRRCSRRGRGAADHGRKTGARAVLDAILHVPRGGLAWRLPPERLPPWRGVHDQFRRWRRAGTWRRINDAPRERALP